MVGGAHEVPPNPEQVQDYSMNGEEALRLSWRFEPAHLPLSLSCRLMRDLRSVIGVLPRVVDNGRHGGAMSGAIARQLVRDQPVGRTLLPLQQLAEEATGRVSIPTWLHEDVDHVAVLVDGPPKILTLALDSHEELVKVPGVAQTTLPPSQRAGVLSPNFRDH